MNPQQDRYAALRIPEFQLILLSRVCATFANRAQVLIFGWQVWNITKSPLAIALLGLTEAVPALGIALFAGHWADRFDRKRIIVTSEIVCALGALTLAGISVLSNSYQLGAIYTIVFVTGLARGIADPAFSAFESQILPRNLYVNGGAWASSTWQACAIIGPAIGGLIFAQFGATVSYLVASALLALSVFYLSKTVSRGAPEQEEHEDVWTSLAGGIKYVVKDHALIGSMSLDLFAVFFGGITAILPMFAEKLKIGPIELGFWNSAPSIGAVIVMIITTKNPPLKAAGRTLLLCVAGFGITMLVFAFSKSFLLSFVVLVFSGIFDGVSMVIRRAIFQLRSPAKLRGRIASVNGIFIGASNELGALESGLAAAAFGLIPSVIIGGSITMLTVGIVAVFFPKLGQLNLLEDMNRLDASELDLA
jgi:MFS family permease